MQSLSKSPGDGIRMQGMQIRLIRMQGMQSRLCHKRSPAIQALLHRAQGPLGSCRSRQAAMLQPCRLPGQPPQPDGRTSALPRHCFVTPLQLQHLQQASNTQSAPVGVKYRCVSTHSVLLSTALLE